MNKPLAFDRWPHQPDRADYGLVNGLGPGP